MSQNARIRNSVIVAAFFAACWLCLLLVVPYNLAFKEQVTLFMCNGAHIRTLLSKPAFFAVLAGDYLTQFFLLTGVGALLTVAVGFALWAGTRSALRRLGAGANASLFALLPVAAEFALSSHVEYPLSMLLGSVIAVWMACGCLSVNNTALRRALSIAATVLAYPVAGAHALLLVILVVASERHNIIYSLICLVASVAVVFFEGWLYMLPAEASFQYPLVPGYLMTRTWLYLLVEVALMCALCGSLLAKGWIAAAVTAAAVALIALCLPLCYDAQREYDLKISSLAYYGQWDKVLQTGKANTFESQTGAYYYNLALVREGRLADELLNVYQPLVYGLFLPVNGTVGYPKVISSVDAHMLTGDYAQAQHSALLGMTFSPNQRSSRAARQLTEISIANGDFDAASKYISMLSKTALHRKWAVEARKWVESGEVTPLNNSADTLFFINDFRAGLKSVLDSDPTRTAAREYLLCFDLLDKNLPLFKEDYDRYYKPWQGMMYAPRIYQEALEMLEADGSYLISEAVKRENQDFLDGNHDKYRNSYWFYYIYARPVE